MQEEFKQAAFPLQPTHSLSRLGLSFGQKDPQDPIKSSISISFSLSKEESEKQLVTLTKNIKNKIDPNYAIICEFNVPIANQSEFLQTLEGMYSPNHQLTELNQALGEMIQSEQIKIDNFLDKENNRVYLMMKLGSAFEEVAISQVKLFTFLGLEKILKDAKNSLEIKLSSKNSMKNILETIKSKNYNLVSALLQQILLEIVIKTSPNLVQDLINLLENMGMDGFLQLSNKSIGFSMLNTLFRKMNSIDIDLQFESTDKLDEAFRKRFMDSVIHIEKIPIDKGDEKNYRTLLKCVEGEFNIYFTISEICAIKATVKLPEFLELFSFYEVGV